MVLKARVRKADHGGGHEKPDGYEGDKKSS